MGFFSHPWSTSSPILEPLLLSPLGSGTWEKEGLEKKGQGLVCLGRQSGFEALRVGTSTKASSFSCRDAPVGFSEILRYEEHPNKTLPGMGADSLITAATALGF